MSIFLVIFMITLFKNVENNVSHLTKFDLRDKSVAKHEPKDEPLRYKPAAGAFHVANGFIRDEFGRARIFHGWNSVEKGFPWYEKTMLNQTQLRLFKEWGLNAVRLGTMWSGVQPTHNTTNTTYLDKLEKIIDLLAVNEHFVLLDMHQDVLAAKFGSYDGAPKWLVDSFPPPAHAYPWPFPDDKHFTNWAEGYITEACGVAFQQIYNNTNRALDYLEAFWKAVAARFKDKPNLLGYELINEPFAGDLYNNADLILPGETGKLNLLPMYDKLNAAIRKIDQNGLIFFEPVTWAVMSPTAGKLGLGFDHVPGGPSYANRSVLSWHYYCQILTATDNPKPIIVWKQLLCDDLLEEEAFTAVHDDVARLKMQHRTPSATPPTAASFLTEFGRCEPDGSANSSNTVECESVMEHADRFLQSWTYWNSHFFMDDGNINWKTVRAFSRPYARAIAGRPTVMRFNNETRHFMLQFDADPKITAPTEVFIPPIHYPNGIRVLFNFNLAYTISDSVIYMTPIHGRDSETCLLYIVPK